MGANGVVKWANQNSVPIVSTWHGTSLSELSAFFPTSILSSTLLALVSHNSSDLHQAIFIDGIASKKSKQSDYIGFSNLGKHMIRHAKGKVVTIPNGVHIPASIEDRGNQEG